MTLSTAGEDGVPDARVLILKDFDPAGRWAFAGSAASPKGRQLAATPAAALTFHWQPLVRSVRIRSTVAPADADVAAQDLRARGEPARAVVLAGGQSEPFSDPRQTEDDLIHAERRLHEDPGLVAPVWRLWWLTASEVEFWQGTRSRQHVRLRYRRAGAAGEREPLRPWMFRAEDGRGRPYGRSTHRRVGSGGRPRPRGGTVFDVALTALDPQLLEYREGWALQRRLHADVVAGTRPASLILCEHEPVYTAGTRTQPEDRPVDGTPVVDVDRGGRITWHGPGQLTGYPITRLPELPGQPGRVDVVAFVRDLEQMMIDVCAGLGVRGERVEGRSGVWVRTGAGWDKVGAIGVRVQKGVTMHGFALNCSNALDAYGAIVPCGIRDAGVTTLSQLTGRRVTPADVVPAVLEHLSLGAARTAVAA